MRKHDSGADSNSY